jgi:hypothetical protein
VIDAAFGVVGKVCTDFAHVDFDRARSEALRPVAKIVAAGNNIMHTAKRGKREPTG